MSAAFLISASSKTMKGEWPLSSIVTLWTTPGGTPHSLQISTICITTPGVITSGLIITEQPAAKAVEIFLADKTAGKFQGVKAATTPTGW